MPMGEYILYASLTFTLGCVGVSVLWPFLSLWLARKSTSSPIFEEMRPAQLTVVIAARNEAECIAEAVTRLYELTQFDIHSIVVSDGSTDSTAEIARGAGANVVVELELPQGKTGALAQGMLHRRNDDIVVFLDATTRVTSEAIEVLLRRFTDPQVGAVSGLVVYEYPDTAIGAGFHQYQQVAVWTRLTDSHWFTAPSVSGAFCAIRPDVWDPTVPHEVTPDLAIPLWTARYGMRAVLASDAICYEDARSTGVAVFRARLRMALQAYSFMAYAWSHRAEVPKQYWCVLVGHKMSRWLIPTAFALTGLALLWVRPLSAVALCLTA